MKSYTVKSGRSQQLRRLLAFKGEAQTIEYDFSPWESDNGAVTSVTWTKLRGQAGISNESLSSSVSSATITTSESGSSMIKITATAGNNIFVTHLRILTKDPDRQYHYDDYGMHTR